MTTDYIEDRVAGPKPIRLNRGEFTAAMNRAVNEAAEKEYLRQFRREYPYDRLFITWETPMEFKPIEWPTWEHDGRPIEWVD